MSKPNQTRAVDPFSSYDSDTVNKLTRIVTHGEDAIEIAKACDVILDSTSNTSVIVQPGVVYKDDLWIKISHEYVVDFNDLSNYMMPSAGFNEPGWHYIVLRYTYKKQRPAPEAEILILKPSQRSVYNSSSDMIFLKAVHATGSGPFYLDAVSSYDPENVQNKREFVKRYAGTEIFIPTFNSARDISRVIYVEEDDTFYFGYSDGWATLKSQGLPYKTKLTLSTQFVVHDDEGVIVPERFEILPSGELIVEGDGVFVIADSDY